MCGLLMVWSRPPRPDRSSMGKPLVSGAPASRSATVTVTGAFIASLIQDLPLVRRGNFQLLAVLGDGAARQLQPLALQNADDLRVAEGLLLVVRLGALAASLLDRHRGHGRALLPRNAA